LTDDILLRDNWWCVLEEVHNSKTDCLGAIKYNLIGDAVSPHLPVVPRKIIDRLGGRIFNPAYYHHWVDNDLGMMCHFLGIEVIHPDGDYYWKRSDFFQEAWGNFESRNEIDAFLFMELWKDHKDVHRLPPETASEEAQKIVRERMQLPGCIAWMNLMKNTLS
jgi:hypothetical protein